MVGWENVVTLVGLALIVGLLVFLFCRHLDGWKGRRSWNSTSCQEKGRMALGIVGLGRIFNPQNRMDQSESELNLSSTGGGGTFRGFEKGNVELDYGQGDIPPQPLRPAPFPPPTSISFQQNQNNPRTSVGSTLFGVDNEPPPPKIPPPPPGKVSERSRNPFIPHQSSSSSPSMVGGEGGNEVKGISMGELLFSSPVPEGDLLGSGDITGGPILSETDLVQTMREEIRLENQRMRTATKDLLGDTGETGGEEEGSGIFDTRQDGVVPGPGGTRKFSAPEIGNGGRRATVDLDCLDGSGVKVRGGPLLTSLRQTSVESMGESFDLSSPDPEMLPFLQRAMSCDSVSSDTSVILGDFDLPHITGYLSVGLEYDSDTADLMVSVVEGKELVGLDPDPTAPFDSYVRVYLLPDKRTNMQTRIYRKSTCPVYKEKFMFGLDVGELPTRSLAFHLYATNKFSNTLLGEAEMMLADFDIRKPTMSWLPLTDTGQRGGEFGEIMFSLSYLPTAERLTVVIVKARNLKFPHDRDSGDPFVKVYLLQKGKKVSKKKSSTKRGEKNPIFNEAMIFSVPTHALQTIQLRITVSDTSELDGRGGGYSIGHVIVGSGSSGKSLSHWNQMLSSLRKPIGMFHPLRK